jgi:phosphoglycolate phosphatase
MLAPRLIVFDLDGTLFDTRQDIAAACNHALVASGRRALGEAVVARYVGDGARRLCARAAGLTDADEELDAIVDDFMTYYLEHPADRASWMPYARETLEALGTTRAAVCTNKAKRITVRLLEAFGVANRFAAVVGAGDTNAMKPSPEPVLLAASTAGCGVGETVVVGDGPQDVEAGRAAGARTIALACGFAPLSALREAAPDLILMSMAELPEVIARWREGTVRSRAVSA